MTASFCSTVMKALREFRENDAPLHEGLDKIKEQFLLADQAAIALQRRIGGEKAEC